MVWFGYKMHEPCKNCGHEQKFHLDAIAGCAIPCDKLILYPGTKVDVFCSCKEFVPVGKEKTEVLTN